MPLGHPAHVLSAGKTTVGAGVAGTIAVTSTFSAATASAGRLQDLAVAPDVSPWVSARVGLGSGFEGGLSASTRSIRLDARRAFESDRWALSVGLGASGVLAARSGGGEATGVYGAGFDLPVLFGWRSSADLYSLWVGPRVGGEIFSGQLDTGEIDPAAASGRHLHVGGLAGLRAGLRHLYAVVEFEFAYHLAAGSLGPDNLEVSAWTVAPFGGLVVSF